MLRIASLVLGCVLILPLGGPTRARARDAFPASTAPVAASGDFAGLVGLGGGRRLWLECRGQGSPTVILEAGAGNDADTWDTVGLARRLGADRGAAGSGGLHPGLCLRPSRNDPRPRSPQPQRSRAHAAQRGRHRR